MIIPKGDPVAWLAKWIKPGQTVIDVGANVGHFSEAMLKAGAHVEAVEPDPRCWKEFRERAPKAMLHMCAAGDLVTVAALTQGKHHAQSSLLASSVTEPIGTVETNVMNIDRLVPGRVEAIKIDVQGSEYSVLYGAQAHLWTCPLWVIEIWPWGSPGFSPGAIYTLMQQHGRYPYTLEDEPQRVSLEDLTAWVAAAQHNSFVNLAWM